MLGNQYEIDPFSQIAVTLEVAVAGYPEYEFLHRDLPPNSGSSWFSSVLFI
jgi:hypothetical protein